MSKTITVIVIVAISGVVLVSLGGQIGDALEAGKRLDNQVEEVARLQERNNWLRERLTEAQNYQTIEEIARNKLNLAKPNETVVIISETALAQVLGTQRKVELPILSNWQGWLKLLLRWP